MNRYKFKDYSLDGFFNHLYAIEPEISREFFEAELEESVSGDYSNESAKIKELSRVHSYDSVKRHEILNKITEFYKDKFPIGNDTYLSGGVHFHVFSGDYKVSWGNLKYKLLNCPLFCKVKGNKLYNRRLSHRSSFNMHKIRNNSKSYCVTFKTHYSTGSTGHRGIEFRCNNVFDSRVYGYYVGIMIAAHEGIKFKKTSESLREYAMNGDKNIYEGNDLEFSEIAGYRISEEDRSAIKKNIITILKLLEKHCLMECAYSLKEYVNECGFEIAYEVTPIDSFTNEKIKHFMKLKSIKLFNKTYEGLYFEKEENFYSFVKLQLKAKFKRAGIPMKFGAIDDEDIIKHYKKYIPQDYKPVARDQASLF